MEYLVYARIFFFRAGEQADKDISPRKIVVKDIFPKIEFLFLSTLCAEIFFWIEGCTILCVIELARVT